MNKKATLEVIHGVGTDIIEVRRIQEAIERHGSRFIDRLFTENEKRYCQRYQNSILHFAGRFAAKEAILKALGTGLQSEIKWKEIEIINNNKGKPEAHLSPRLQRLFPLTHLFISISHCEDYATATAILTGVTNGAS